MKQSELGSRIDFASEDVFRKVVHSVRNYAIFALTPDGRVASWNEAAERVKGWKEEEVIGQHFRMFFRPEEREARQPERNLEATARDGFTEEDGIRLRSNGSTYPVHASLASIRDDQGRLHGFVKVIHDRTEDVRREERLRDLNRQLEALVEERTKDLTEAIADVETSSYTIAHDLRAPARAMHGFAELLLENYSDRRLDARAAHYLERIKAAAARMDRLVSDVLTVSQASRMSLSSEWVNLDKLLPEIIDQSTFLATAGAKITVRPELGAVWAHEGTVGQCVSNLLNNATKFAKPGTCPAIEIWRDDRHGAPRLWIRDEGIGVPSEYHERIFRMFEQLPGPAMAEGTGAGLAVVNRSMERMGGATGVISERDKGSAFFLEFALRANDLP